MRPRKTSTAHRLTDDEWDRIIKCLTRGQAAGDLAGKLERRVKAARKLRAHQSQVRAEAHDVIQGPW